MKEWFDELDGREKGLLLLASSFLLTVVLFLVVVEPLFARATELQASVDARRTDLAFVQRGAAEIQAAGGASEGAVIGEPERPLLVLVDQTVRSANLSGLNLNQPGSDDSVKVRFEGSSFDALARWLGMLATQHNVMVESGSIERQATSGLVDASLTLKRGS